MCAGKHFGLVVIAIIEHRSVVAAQNDEGVIGDAELMERCKDFPDSIVKL